MLAGAQVKMAGGRGGVGVVGGDQGVEARHRGLEGAVAIEHAGQGRAALHARGGGEGGQGDQGRRGARGQAKAQDRRHGQAGEDRRRQAGERLGRPAPGGGFAKSVVMGHQVLDRPAR